MSNIKPQPKLSNQTKVLLNNIITHRTMKYKNTSSNTPNNTSNNSNTSRTHKHKHKKKYNTHNNNHNHNNTHNNTNTNTYVNKLIKTYRDYNVIGDKYLAEAHHKMHLFPPQKRIIVIGDIHGDLKVAIKCLILAKCIKYIEPPTHKDIDVMDAFYNTLEWIGGETYVVQLGDQIDRVRTQSLDKNNISQDIPYEDEGSTLEIFYLFLHLDNLAKQQGGRVLSLLGNHEIMNINGDFSYVSREEFTAFQKHLGHLYTHNNSRKSKKNYSHNTQSRKNISNLPYGYYERLGAFKPTGLCANLLGYNYYTMLQIGNWLFCHGSPTLFTTSNYSIDLINNVVSMYLLGIDSKGKHIQHHYDEITNSRSDDNQTDKSVLWDRTFGDGINKDITLCAKLDIILDEYNKTNNIKDDSLKAKYVAVGHTPQTDGQGINAICNNRVWRCDIAMSRAFAHTNKKWNENNIQILEILNNIPKVLKLNVF